jgi:hypothetical protein
MVVRMTIEDWRTKRRDHFTISPMKGATKKSSIQVNDKKIVMYEALNEIQ